MQGRVARASSLTVALLLVLPAWASAQTNSPAKPSPWKFGASVGVKETFDSNVYLQDQTPQANRESLVTTILPQVAATWKPGAAFSAALTYSPEVTWYHSESSEDYVLHRGVLNLSGKLDQTAYDWTTTAVLIDGSSIGPTWTGPGGAPAAGGPAVRDRRDAAVYRSNLRVTQTVGEWLVRPAATFYLHDFQTVQSAAAGYQNYVDRSEFTGGLDAGRRIKSLTAWLGYRFGVQDQDQLLASPVQYDSTFHRVLFGLEGAPLSWLKFNVVLGPEFRHYDDKDNKLPVGFDPDRVLLFVDSSLSLLPTKADTVTLSIKQFQQPGFGGRSAYTDLTYDLGWRHKFNATWTTGLSGRAYNTDFLAPVSRDDWIFSGSAFVNWAVTKKLNAEASYTFESGESMIPNTSGREYTRHLVALGVKYVFK
jgi:hypothetical protein